MLRPRRFDTEIDPGPVQIQARKVHFDLSDIPLEWIPGHPVASTMINLFNVVLPPAEHWFVKTFNEALPLVKDPRLADEMRGFIGQEATHAAAHDEGSANSSSATVSTPHRCSKWSGTCSKRSWRQRLQRTRNGS